MADDVNFVGGTEEDRKLTKERVQVKHTRARRLQGGLTAWGRWFRVWCACRPLQPLLVTRRAAQRSAEDTVAAQVQTCLVVVVVVVVVAVVGVVVSNGCGFASGFWGMHCRWSVKLSAG